MFRLDPEQERSISQAEKRRIDYRVYNAQYSFTVDEEEFEDTVTLTNKTAVGDSIKVYYNPDNPSEYMTNVDRNTTT